MSGYHKNVLTILHDTEAEISLALFQNHFRMNLNDVIGYRLWGRIAHEV